MAKIKLLPDIAARVPATIQVKLLGAFSAIVTLLILFGVVGLQVLSGVNRRSEYLITFVVSQILPPPLIQIISR